MKRATLILCTAAIALLSSCNVQKRIVYIQDAENINYETALADKEIRIKPLDRLTVVIVSKNPELAAPFNAASSYNSLTANPTGTTANAASLQVRTITPEGILEMPILGAIDCNGLTRAQLAAKIADMIKSEGYFDDPIVNVQFADMRISVLGEVARPGVFTVQQDRISILDALALAGDLTIFGVRDQVAVIRETENGNAVEFLDLTSADIFSSPYFYLHQNDVVYVRPNKYKAATSEINQNRTFWLSIVGTLVSVATLLITIIKIS